MAKRYHAAPNQLPTLLLSIDKPKGARHRLETSQRPILQTKEPLDFKQRSLLLNQIDAQKITVNCKRGPPKDVATLILMLSPQSLHFSGARR